MKNRCVDAKRTVAVIRGQKGFALILTMVMLAILSILGVMVLNTTNTELTITTNYRASSDAFVAAELAMEYAQDRILRDRSAADLSEDEDLAILLPAGIALVPDGLNEVDSYVGPMPRRMAAGYSVDATAKGNVYRTTASGSSGSPMPYYRTTVETVARQRSSARLETVQIDLTGL
jgi:Tfp pilus assembly protein PilX